MNMLNRNFAWVGLIPRSGVSINGLNRVSNLIILGVSETPPLDFFFKKNMCHRPLTKQTF
jgi:hypothetical protein